MCFPPSNAQSRLPYFCGDDMKLYAAGFNAWNQLNFRNDTGDEEPEDVARFQCVLEDRRIESPYASLSCTVGTGLTLTAENGRCGAKTNPCVPSQYRLRSRDGGKS